MLTEKALNGANIAIKITYVSKLLTFALKIYSIKTSFYRQYKTMWENIKLSSFIERTKGSFPLTNIIIECISLRKKLKIGLNIFCEIVNILNPTHLRREPWALPVLRSHRPS